MENAHPLVSPDLELGQTWDVIIVGTGMGGSTAGYTLAKSGLRVLFLEKGSSIRSGELLKDEIQPEQRLAAGWWPHPVSRRLANGQYERFYAPVGCGVGGSTLHYAAALERMESSDFQALAAEKQNIPPWPVAYDEFEHFYKAAEALYGIQNAAPNAESRLSDWDRALMNSLRDKGFRPDMLNVAIRYDEKCQECIGKVCPRRCKSDARTACLDQALQLPNCRILENCDVQTLDAEKDHVRSVRATYQSKTIELKARIVILAAGALHSPAILLRSNNLFWPNGLANRSDQVGRNLMLHTTPVFALWAPRRFNRNGRQKKSLSIRDFYVHNGQRLGYVQSMGLDAGRGHIAMYLKDILRKFGIHNKFLLSLLVKIPSVVGAWALGDAGVFVLATEDDPDPENRIVIDKNEPDGSSLAYTITNDLRVRADTLYAVFKQAVKPWTLVKMSPILDMNYGHACGTCRFGNDPEANVLDINCKAHGVDNLYVVDASFMPRSGAVNPSLTIAANAIRVARHISSELKSHPL